SDGADSTLTQAGFRAMTPRYASPEQVRGDPVSVATDVYSLGTVLYELLTGRPAHNIERTTATEIERVVCEVEPDAPSAAALRDDEQRAARAELRGTDPPRLARQLHGDLDTIVLEALRKEPARRYATVDALLDDLRRYTDGRPVHARPDTWAYRTGKFVR